MNPDLGVRSPIRCVGCDPGQLSNLSGPHSLIYKIGYPQFPSAPGINPLAGSYPGFSPYQAQLAHRYTKFNATSQVWKPGGLALMKSQARI